jgi:hypothetical protein
MSYHNWILTYQAGIFLDGALFSAGREEQSGAKGNKDDALILCKFQS